MVTEKSRGRRGMFMTISILMLGMIVLSLVVFLSEEVTASKVSAAEFNKIDRTSGTYSNIEDEISRIVSFYINVSAGNKTVTVEEPLPFPSKMTDALEAFSQFERAYSEQNISMNLTNTKKGNFIITPGHIDMKSSPGSFMVSPHNSTESAGSVESYYVELAFGAGEVKSATWNILSNSSGDLVHVHVMAHDPNYAAIIETYGDVDRHGTSELSINSGSGNGTQVGLVRFSSPAGLEIQGGSAIGLKTIVGFYNLVEIETNDTISIVSAVNKTGKVRIT